MPRRNPLTERRVDAEMLDAIAEGRLWMAFGVNPPSVDDIVFIDEEAELVYLEDQTFICSASRRGRDRFPLEYAVDIYDGENPNRIVATVVDHVLVEDYHEYVEIDGRHYETDRCVYINNSEWVTQYEYENAYFTCDSCGRTFENDEYGSDGLCNSCWAERLPDEVEEYGAFDDVRLQYFSHHSMGWKYSPFHPDGRLRGGDSIFMGWENELLFGDRGDMTAVLDGLAHWCKLTKDVSIKGFGAEVVSHPGTLKFWQKLVAEGSLDPMFDGGISHKSCGMHVHVGYLAFEGTPVYRVPEWLRDTCSYSGHNDCRPVGVHLLKFIRLWKEITATDERSKWMCGRPPVDYAQRLTQGDAELVKHRNNDRYSVVNLCKNTAEIRIFASTVNKFKFLSNLELVHATVTYSRDAAMNRITFELFRDWVLGQSKKLYPNLRTTIEGAQ